MTTPEPLILTDVSGDTLEAYATPAGSLGVTIEEDERGTVLLDRDQARQLLRFLADYLQEPAVLAVQADVFAFTDTAGIDQRIANRSLGDCPRCGHPIHAGAFVKRYPAGQHPRWAHEECTPPAPQPFPPAASKTAITGDATVTHVEGTPQP
jgi:hypothetical protein